MHALLCRYVFVVGVSKREQQGLRQATLANYVDKRKMSGLEIYSVDIKCKYAVTSSPLTIDAKLTRQN